jgi:uroporphyrin-III C-methyltransferase
MSKTAGKVFLVGAGPGAPDLLTLRAAEVLKRADIVFHDALVHPEVLALASRAERIAVGKRCGRFATAQQFINKRLVDAARKHQVVVRLKGGDPMLFGRAQEEIDALRAAGVAVEVVAGVTAALAACADLKISLTQRGVSRNVALVTPRIGAGQDPSEWIKAVCNADSAAIYMAAGQAQTLSSSLLSAGLAADTAVMIVENASLPSVRSMRSTLAELLQAAEQLGDGPAIILLGAAFAHAVGAGELNIETGAELSDLTPKAMRGTRNTAFA